MQLFWKIQIVLVELYKHYWPWSKNSEKVHYKSHNKETKTRNALKKVERTQRIPDEMLERVAYDPKSVEKTEGIVE